jgi:hypothetical protein
VEFTTVSIIISYCLFAKYFNDPALIIILFGFEELMEYPALTKVK